MANVSEVHITGWMPFDIVQHEKARTWLGIMNGPSYGLGITYGQVGTGPENEHGGHTTYYRFQITGNEAIWTTGTGRAVQALVGDLIAGGALIEKALSMDVEYDRDNPRWYDLLQHFPGRKEVEVTPGDPLMDLLIQREEEKD